MQERYRKDLEKRIAKSTCLVLLVATLSLFTVRDGSAQATNPQTETIDSSEELLHRLPDDPWPDPRILKAVVESPLNSEGKLTGPQAFELNGRLYSLSAYISGDNGPGESEVFFTLFEDEECADRLRADWDKIRIQNSSSGAAVPYTFISVGESACTLLLKHPPDVCLIIEVPFLIGNEWCTLTFETCPAFYHFPWSPFAEREYDMFVADARERYPQPEPTVEEEPGVTASLDQPSGNEHQPPVSTFVEHVIYVRDGNDIRMIEAPERSPERDFVGVMDDALIMARGMDRSSHSFNLWVSLTKLAFGNRQPGAFPIDCARVRVAPVKSHEAVAPAEPWLDLAWVDCPSRKERPDLGMCDMKFDDVDAPYYLLEVPFAVNGKEYVLGMSLHPEVESPPGLAGLYGIERRRVNGLAEDAEALIFHNTIFLSLGEKKVFFSAYLQYWKQGPYIEWHFPPQDGPDVVLDIASIRLRAFPESDGSEGETLEYASMHRWTDVPQGDWPSVHEPQVTVCPATSFQNYAVLFDGQVGAPYYWLEFDLRANGERYPCGIQFCRFDLLSRVRPVVPDDSANEVSVITPPSDPVDTVNLDQNSYSVPLESAVEK